MKKIIYFLLIITFVSSPLSVIGCIVFRPLPEGDWTLVDQNSQQAFINYEQGIEKLIIAVDIEGEDSDMAWIIPVPSTPEKVEIDITSEWPIFFGDDVISKAKLKFSESLKDSYFASLHGQIWVFPFSIIFVSMGPRELKGEMSPGDLFLVERHIEKAGMIAEVITAKDGQAIYNYFSQKGFNIKPGSISELNSYIEKDYSFVVSWIAPGTMNEKYGGQRGIFISFPTSKIYYPLILTSAYGELEIPIIIRILDYVKPEIFPEIKPFIKVNYFTERTKDYAFAPKARYRAKMRQLGDIRRGEYFQAALAGKFWIPESVWHPEPKGEFISPELQKFYGNKKAWKGEADYTKITINAPAKVLTKDLWVKRGRPLKISLALWSINHPLVVGIFLYLLIVGFFSFIAGGLAGLLCYRKFKKYALLGLSNIFTLIGLILASNYVKKKRGEDIRYSKFSFIFSFSIIFVSLLVLASLPPLLWVEETELWFLLVIEVVGIGITGGILLLIDFLLNKIGLKNRTIRAILTIVLFIIFWIAIGVLFFSFLL